MANRETLQGLTQATYDTLEAYRRAHETAHTGALERTLERRISERTRTVNLLNDALEKQGGERVDDASASAQAGYLVQAIGDAFQDGDEAAAHRIEKAETDLCERYEKALADDTLETSTRHTIEAAAREVREGESFSHVLERQFG
ncbi:DUF2383 domain-containing protein [Erythrobacter sp.]|uniref:DUF2383 domain-containing protein n=1 Tax=Erythrobacter sp. TaxID=1042 RepID=UPI001425CCFC|nr:DUF2383 domain-containing protein [Erythrobacter sp.]QIQ86482.1 MAG: DUF2383 domain-containing protein [Erythrobacter sp.]